MLVFCHCAHAIEGHDAGGCNGDQAARCPCRLSKAGALEAAVDAVRTVYSRERSTGDKQKRTNQAH